MASDLNQLIQSAHAAANSGRWDEAEKLWQQVHRRQPDQPDALFSLGVHALKRGDAMAARGYLLKACDIVPQSPLIPMMLARAEQALGDAAKEREAIERTLAIDAYYLPGMLAKAEWLERNSTPAIAAAMYMNCLKVAPAEAQWPAPLRDQLLHARKVSARHSEAFHAHLSLELKALQTGLPDGLQGRWREATSIKAGKTRPYQQDCNQLHVPRLPAIPFYGRADFPWVEELEARTGKIRSELETALKADRERFQPYITYRPGEPVNQWQDLNHSERWSAFHLWRGGKPEPENLERCPETTRALEKVILADIEGLCPNAMFSALAPKTRIPPHHGETNARLVVHLPLIVPDGCWYRVGFERRNWKVGEVLIFDDTIEHEAGNDGDELRVVLIFDVWNPLLTPAERDLVRAMTTASRAFKS